MTFSIEDLPAPFGPMIARISRLRTSKLTSASAFTPPNASEMFSTESRTSPMARALLIASCRFGASGDRERLDVPNRNISAEDPAAAVLEFNHGLDVPRLHTAV